MVLDLLRKHMYRIDEPLRLSVIVVLILWLMATITFADVTENQTPLPNLTSNESLVTLNDRLRQVNSRLSELTGIAYYPIQLGSSTKVAGVLPVVNGGTGATTPATALNNLLTDQAGNAGKFLTTDGSVYGWAAQTTPGLKLTQIVAMSSSTSSGNILIDSTKNYFVLIKTYFQGLNPIYIRFNGDTGSNYGYYFGIVGNVGASTIGTGTSSANATSIYLHDGSGSITEYTYAVYINYRVDNLGSEKWTHVLFDGSGLRQTGGNKYVSRVDGSGMWYNGTPTYFTLNGTDMHGYIYLYELTQ